MEAGTQKNPPKSTKIYNCSANKGELNFINRQHMRPGPECTCWESESGYWDRGSSFIKSHFPDCNKPRVLDCVVCAECAGFISPAHSSTIESFSRNTHTHTHIRHAARLIVSAVQFSFLHPSNKDVTLCKRVVSSLSESASAAEAPNHHPNFNTATLKPDTHTQILRVCVRDQICLSASGLAKILTQSSD